VSTGTLPRPYDPVRAPAVRPVAVGRWGRPKLHVGIGERLAALMLGDLALLNAGLALCLFALPHPAWLVVFEDNGPAPVWFLLLSALWLFVGAVADLFNLEVAGNRFASPYRAITVAVTVMVIYSLVPVITPALLKSRLMWAALVVVTTVPIAVWRLAYALVMSHPVLVRRVLIVGGGQPGRLVADAIVRNPASGFRLVGYVDRELGEEVLTGVPLLGAIDDLERVVQAAAVDELVIASSGPMVSSAYHAITLAYEAGIRVTPMATLYQRLTGKIPVQHVGDYWLTVLPEDNGATASYAVAKRALDLAGALVGLVVLALVFVPLALAIYIESGGPIFFSQTRLGRRGVPFRILKFRSVAVSQAAVEKSIWERKSTTPTRIGRVLRRMRVDELPQFINILRGEMSLVGPRPFVPEEVEELERHIPFFRSRLLVQPGLTGWAQVKADYGTTLADELEKLQYDLFYIRHRSLALDLVIVVKTLAVVLRFAGR
jgi:exopolysaccharide biosynthesis polyprenyl glycosylphosphotransferase